MSIDDDDEATRILPSHAPKAGSPAQRTEIAPERTEIAPPAGSFDPDGDATVIRPRRRRRRRRRGACRPRRAATCCRSASIWASSRSSSVIGEGGFGIVYLACDHSLDRTVALKEYMPSSLAHARRHARRCRSRSERHRETFEAGLKSFVNEARLLAQFDHPVAGQGVPLLGGERHRLHGDAVLRGHHAARTRSRAMGAPPDEAWLTRAAGAADRGARGDPRRAVLSPRHRARQRDPAAGRPAGRCCSTSAPRAASSAT